MPDIKNNPPCCPKCGFVMVQKFREEDRSVLVRDVVLERIIAIPTGEYECLSRACKEAKS